MKRFARSAFALLFLLAATVLPARAEPVLTLSVDLGGALSAFLGAFAGGENPGEEIFAEFARRTGTRPDKDITRFGAVVDDLMKEEIAIFLDGKFDVEKLSAALAADAHFPFKADNLGALRAFRDERTRIVMTATRVLIGPIGSPFFADEKAVRDLAARVHGMDRSASFSLELAPPKEMRPMLFANLPPDIPPPVAGVLRATESFAVKVDAEKIAVRLTVDDPATMDAARKIYEGLTEMAKARFAAEERDGRAAMEKASTLQLFSGDVFGKIQGAAAGRRMLELLKLNFEGKSCSLVLDRSAVGSLPLIIPAVGVLAAIAIPNFQRARETARQKACYSSMRVLEGACELMMMEVNQPPAEFRIEELVSGGYLKSSPECPEDGEFSIRRTDDGVEVTCSKHGKVR